MKSNQIQIIITVFPIDLTKNQSEKVYFTMEIRNEILVFNGIVTEIRRYILYVAYAREKPVLFFVQ